MVRDNQDPAGARELARLVLAKQFLPAEYLDAAREEAPDQEGHAPGESGSPRAPSPSPSRLADFRRAANERFELGPSLGRGGMGAVFEALERSTGRPVAIKIMFGSPGGQVRFRREAEITARLDHPGIVRIHDFGVFAEVPFIVYERIEGQPLHEAASTLTRPRRLQVMLDLARALGHAHRAGVVHRDLKPSNVMIDGEGRARVVDFGIALGSDLGRLTRTGVFVGTPQYAAPEQLAGEKGGVGPQADVWALGVLLYELLCDSTPFPANSLADLMASVVRATPVSPRELDSSIPEALERVCLNALQVDLTRRYADATAFEADLSLALAGKAIRRNSPLKGRAVVVLGSAGLLVALAAGVGALAPAEKTQATLEEPAESAAGKSVEDARPAPRSPVALTWVREPLSSRSGILTHPPRQLEVVSGVGLVLEDPRLKGARLAPQSYLDSGPVLRTFDLETLALGAARRVQGGGRAFLTTAPGVAASTTEASEVVQLWSLPDLEPMSQLRGHPGQVTAIELDASGERLLVAAGGALFAYSASGGELLWRRPVSTPIHALKALPGEGGFLLQRARPLKKPEKAKKGKKPEKAKKPALSRARLELRAWDGSLTKGALALQAARIWVHPSGTRAMVHHRGPPRAQLWTVGPALLKLERVVRTCRDRDRRTKRDYDLLFCLPSRDWKRALTLSSTGWVYRSSLQRYEWDGNRVSATALTAAALDGERAFVAGVDGIIRTGRFTKPWTNPLDPARHEGPITALAGATGCERPIHVVARDAQGRAATDPAGAVDTRALRAVYAFPMTPKQQSPEAEGTELRWVNGDGSQGVAFGEEIEEISERVTVLALLPTPERSLLAAFLSGGVSVFEDEAWRVLIEPQAEPDQRGKIQTLALASDPKGELLFVAGESETISIFRSRSSQARPITLSGPQSPVLKLAATRTLLFAGEANGSVGVYDLGKQELAFRLPGSSPVTALLPQERGQLLNVACADGSVKIWSLRERAVVAEAPLPQLDFGRVLDLKGSKLRVGTQLGRIYAAPLPDLASALQSDD